MYRLQDIVTHIHTLFNTTSNETYHSECGVTHDAKQPIKTIGYCTNLTPDSIEQAHRLQIDLLVTHHDAWSFIYGMKDRCNELLQQYNMSHFFTHLPLDDADFGTNSSLLQALHCTELGKYSLEDGYYCGALGELNKPILFSELVKQLEHKLGEPVLAWKYHDRLIKNVFVVCGAGFTTDLMKEAIDVNADVYITGEKILYTVQYAKEKGLNLMIGSHTFTELFGVESLVRKIKEAFPNVTIQLVEEEHIETSPLGSPRL